MEKELQTIEKSVYFNPKIWDQMQRIGQAFMQSNALSADIRNLPQLMMKLQAGYELGMQPIESLNSLYLVGGKVTMWGEAVLRRLRHFGFKLEYIESNDKICKVKAISPDGEEFLDQATFEEAEKSGWTKDRAGKIKFNYKCPADKLRYNAIRRLCKFYCPEVLGNMDMKESADDYVEAEVVEEKKPEKKEKKEEVEIKEEEEPKMKPKEVEEKPIKKEKKIEVPKETKIPKEIKEKDFPKAIEKLEEEKEERKKIKEARAIVVKLFKIKGKDDPTKWKEKDLEGFMSTGIDNLFATQKLEDLDDEELDKYINLINQQITKHQKQL